MRIEAHAVWLLAVEAYAGAETDAGLNAAASLFDTEPWRARPSSGRAELDRIRSTTSKVAISAKATAGPHCILPRAAASAFAEHKAERAHEVPHGTFAGITKCRASPPGEAERHQLARPCLHAGLFVGELVCEVLLFIFPVYDRASKYASPTSSTDH